MFADERHELVGCDQKCDGIYEAEQSQDYKSCQPIRISRCEKLLENAFVSHSEILLNSRQAGLQRSTV